MPLLSTIGAAAARAFGFLRSLVAGGYNVANSLRFNSASDDSLTRTFGSSGNRKTWTFSTWIKRSNLINANMNILGTDYASNGEAYFVFRPGEKLLYGQYEGGGTSNNFSFETTQVFRDVSAWYNILLVWDTTQSTSSDRMKIYINGTQVTSFSSATYPTQNLDGVWNSNRVHYIGDAFYGTNLDGYLSETYFIDGQALTPSSFGETDETTGIWKPKEYTGTFGTNGFYLEFQNSSSLGTDSSGNGNNWTVNNLTSVDQSTDTPTNNFCTLSSIDINTGGTAGTLTEGNLKLAHLSGASGSHTIRRGTIAVNKGKWFSEYKLDDIGSGTDRVGIINIAQSNYVTDTNPYVGFFSAGYAYLTNGNKENNDSQSAYGASYTTGDIIGVAFDADNGTLTFYKNGTSQGTAFTGLDTSLYYTFSSSPYNNQTGSHNFGSPSFTISSGNADANGFGNFEYAVPSGYYALCTKNLAEYA